MYHHRISVHQWCRMSKAERVKRVNRFVSDTSGPIIDTRLATSKDGKLTVKKATNSKKPNQRKQARAEKSFSAKKDKALMMSISDSDN